MPEPNTTSADQTATPEQIKEMREKMMTHYEEQMPLMEKELAFETLAANIEEQRLRRFKNKLSITQLMASVQDKKEAVPSQPDKNPEPPKP